MISMMSAEESVVVASSVIFLASRFLSAHPGLGHQLCNISQIVIQRTRRCTTILSAGGKIGHDTALGGDLHAGAHRPMPLDADLSADLHAIADLRAASNADLRDDGAMAA